jgi:hypothetical protein
MQTLSNTGWPRNLSFITKRLGIYSRQNFRMESISNSSASASQIITVDLLSNSLLDFSTFQMYFQGSTTSGGGGSCAFPKNIESIIQKIDIEISGQTISTGFNEYGQLFNLINSTTCGSDAKIRRTPLQNGGDQPVPGANIVNQSFCINQWLGFLGSCAPNIINTAQTGVIKLRITLATPQVLIQTGACPAPGFTLSNIMFSIDKIDLDPIFHDVANRYLASGASYEVPYLNYLSFSSSVIGSFSQNNKFSLSTQSLNHVWGMYYSPTSGLDGVTKNSSYFTRLSDNMSSSQFNINGLFYPNWAPSPEQCLSLLTNSYNASYDTLGGWDPNLNSLAVWRNQYFTHSVRLDHGSDGVQLISGQDTRGTNCQCYWQTVGAPWATVQAPIMSLVFCETTSSLLISAGRNIQIIL